MKENDIKEKLRYGEGFCPPQVKKVIFLDIGGVLKAESMRDSYERAKGGELNNLPNELYKINGIDYGKYSLFQVASIYYDWDKEAVSLLKDIMIKTGAKFVLSSDWRVTYGREAMYDFFAIHGLQDFYMDNTMFISRDMQQKYYQEYFSSTFGFLNLRAIEILEYVKKYPHITHYAVIDDINLANGLENHFVRTDSVLTPYHAAKVMEILT
jgi:hypothetical protein